MSEKFYYERKILCPSVVLWRLGGVPSLQQWDEFAQAATEWMQEEESRGCRWSVVIDPSGMSPLSSSLRRAAGQWRAENMPLIANTVHCACYVAEGAVLRGAIAAILWIARPVIPVSIRSSREEAQRWVQTKRAELVIHPRAVG